MGQGRAPGCGSLLARAGPPVVALFVPLLLTLAACSPNPSTLDATGSGATTGTTGIPPEPDDTTLSTDTAAPTTVAKVALDRTLNKGDTGDDVRRMQQRLKDLAFDPGVQLDGVYGETTAQAVWAYKALIIGERWDRDLSSKVTPAVWDRMQDPLGWTPRKTGGTPRHLEILLPEQVAVLVSDGQVRLVTHISSGSGKHWCLNRRPPPKSPNDTTVTTVTTVTPVTTVTAAAAPAPAEYCGDSITPAGSYTFWAKRTGIFQGYYGDLYNAAFFNGGIAVHGFDSVPYYPDSHGCVRIPNHIANYFQSLVRTGDQVFVFDGVHDPEVLGPVPPPEDVKSTTTTGPTTSAAATTTTARATTVAATTAPAASVPVPIAPTATAPATSVAKP